MIHSRLALLTLLTFASPTVSNEKPPVNGPFDRLTPEVMPAPKHVTAYNRPRPFCHDTTNGKCSIYWTNVDEPNQQLVASSPQGTVRFPKLKPGVILPMFGRLYRFSEKGDFVKLNRELEKLGLHIQRDSVAIPLHQDEMGHFSSIVRRYAVAKLFASLNPVASDSTTELSVNVREHLSGADRTHTALKVKDTFQVGKTKFRIRQIVPHNSEKSILGWVELQCEPFKASLLK